MSGVDKIIEKINSDSENICSSVIADSEKKCGKIAAEAEEKGKAIFAEIEKKAVSEGESIISMARSAALQSERQTILKAKVEALDETLGKLTDTLRALPAGEYFDAVIKLASKNCMPGSCTASLNAADLARMPSDFAGKLTAALGAAGAECSLSDKPSDIGSGVFLDYGNIGIDCSFEAVIEENSDLYKEKISRIIF